MPQTKTGHVRHSRAALPLCRSGIGIGTGILTPEGELPVEFLEPGDRVITHDQGAVRLSRLIVREVAAREVVRVSPSMLTPEVAVRDILISAQQQLVIRDWRARAMFGKSTALVPAAKLVDGRHMVRLAGATPVRLFQLVFDDAQHVVPLANGQILATSVQRLVRQES